VWQQLGGIVFIALLSMLSLPFSLGHYQAAFFLLLQHATVMRVVLRHSAVSLVVLQRFPSCCRVWQHVSSMLQHSAVFSFVPWHFAMVFLMPWHSATSCFVLWCLEGIVRCAPGSGGVACCATAIQGFDHV